MHYNILVVDDDTNSLDVTVKLLAKSGYQVVKAGNGQQAMEVWKNHPARIDLLLTDVFMPDMTGIELAAALRVLQPELKVIFMTGATRDMVDELVPNPEEIRLLKKTASAEHLRQCVRSALMGD